MGANCKKNRGGKDMAESNVIVKYENRIATIILNRPQAMNALNRELVNELTEALEAVQGNKEIRCIVLTGNGKGFCAGGDLGHLAELSDPIHFKKSIDYFISNSQINRAKFLFFILNRHYDNYGLKLFKHYIKNEEFEKCQFTSDFYQVDNLNDVTIEQIEYDEPLMNTNDVGDILAESILRLKLNRSELKPYLAFVAETFNTIVGD